MLAQLGSVSVCMWLVGQQHHKLKRIGGEQGSVLFQGAHLCLSVPSTTPRCGDPYSWGQV